MASENGVYAELLSSYEPDLLKFLRTFESIQEKVRPGELRGLQSELVGATGDTFRRFDRDFAPLAPPKDRAEFHKEFVIAVAHMERSLNLFLVEPGPNWVEIFLRSRSSLVRGLYALYDLRASLPTIARHFSMEGDGAVADSPAEGHSGAPVGFSHHEPSSERGEYSLYVPEHYSPARQWPLIICLHGGYGHGSEYIWTWLRPARSKGYILLSPKSWAETWTMTIDSPDTRSVMRMLDEVGERYAVDRSRVYLTGLSDGGIFTYIMGLQRHEVFTALAPVAGALHAAADPMLRTGSGRELPIFVIHGVHDFIFPVTFTRQTNELLTMLKYNVKYEELPDWGHALTYSINERLVLPWFESLPPRTE
jgi:phospholipase/carboxylesterase